MERYIKYFGYGANRDPEMMAAIIGRRPRGILGTLPNYELRIQTWPEIPQRVRKLLVNWDERFRTYCIKPKKEAGVAGVMWHITRKERKLIDHWEINGLWYESANVVVLQADGKAIRAETEVMGRLPARLRTDGLKYRTFLNPKNKMLEAARRDRKEALRSLR